MYSIPSPITPASSRSVYRLPTPAHYAYPHTRLSGGRTWWAHFEFTRINTTPTILPEKIEDVREARASYVRSNL
jgi:hypothetical protein